MLVDRTNKKKYVDCYVEYELIESIKKQFEYFFNGFKRVYNTNCHVYVSKGTCVSLLCTSMFAQIKCYIN